MKAGSVAKDIALKKGTASFGLEAKGPGQAYIETPGRPGINRI